jgi:uncharacterized protein (TIGR02246 family)
MASGGFFISAILTLISTGSRTGFNFAGWIPECLLPDRRVQLTEASSVAGTRMTISIRLNSLALLATALVSAPVLCAQTAAADSLAIHKLAQQFSAAYMRGDAAAMAHLYTSDAVIFPERSERITGREAITRYWTLAPGRRVTRHKLIPSRIVVDGDHAYDYGSYEIAGERDGTPWGPFRGKYVVVWRRDKGVWRMHLDIWNSGPES